ncbi:Transcriptional regulator [Candidatus Terasakiella magnetica]|nr:Transcriptional regulator [Candidatus Terasakiella magnetica]
MSTEAHDRQFVVALARGLDILRCFRADEPLLGNQDIAKRTGLAKPTVSRLTYTLTQLGYLVHEARFGKYRLGAPVLSLGYAALAGLDVRQVARPFMEELALYSDVAVSLGSPDRTSMIYTESCRGRGALTIRLGVGSRVPLATSAMGRAYLAALSEAERTRLLDEVRRFHPENWERVAAGVEQAIKDYQTRGFVLSLGEWQSDIHAIGTTIRLPDSGQIMGLNCGGAAFVLPRERLEQDLGPRLVEIARRIEASLGA